MREPTGSNAEQRMKEIVRLVASSTKIAKKRAAEDTLINELVPQLVARTRSEVAHDIRAFATMLGIKDAELAEFSSADKLRWFVNPVLESYSVHTEDEYSVAIDVERRVAAIAVHNKGSQFGRILSIPVWKGDFQYYSLR